MSDILPVFLSMEFKFEGQVPSHIEGPPDDVEEADMWSLLSTIPYEGANMEYLARNIESSDVMRSLISARVSFYSRKYAPVSLYLIFM